MPRGLTPDQKAASKALLKRPAMFVALTLPADSIYAWDGAFDVTVLGHVFKGCGQFGIIEGLGSERTTRANAIRIGLMGLPSDKVPSDFLRDAGKISYQNQPLKIYMGFCNTDTDVPLADPFLYWSGVADVLSSKNAKTVSVSLSGTNYSSRLRFTNGLRMTNQSHVRRVSAPNDNFYSFGNRLLAKSKAL